MKKDYLFSEIRFTLKWAKKAFQTRHLKKISLANIDMEALVGMIGELVGIQKELKLVKRNCTFDFYVEYHRKAEARVREIAQLRRAMTKMADLQIAIREKNLKEAWRLVDVIYGMGYCVTTDIEKSIEELCLELGRNLENKIEDIDHHRYYCEDESEDIEPYPGAVNFDEEFDDSDDDEDGEIGSFDDETMEAEDFGNDFPDGGTGSTVIPFTFPKREQTN
jgi:hypothetical protein